MFKAVLLISLICSAAYAATLTVEVAKPSTAPTTGAKPEKIEMLMDDSATAPDSMKLSFKYSFLAGQTVAVVDTQRDLLVCCVKSAKDTTDSHAAALDNRCIAVQTTCTGGGSACDATASKYKTLIAQGVKNSANMQAAYIVSGATGDAFSAGAGQTLTSNVYSLNEGMAAALGLVTSVATEVTLD